MKKKVGKSGKKKIVGRNERVLTKSLGKEKTVESKKPATTKEMLGTTAENTWCPMCPNFLILEAFKQTVAKFIDSGKYRHEDFAMTADVGCHGKIFDYVNLSGFYTLHGRTIPVAMGMKLGNPHLKVIAFGGDGAIYSEGISHFIHMFKYNPDISLFVHDNQSFSLTTGQPTPTSQKGYVAKSEPLGKTDIPFNPLFLAFASGATFIARTNARDLKHMVATFTKAINFKGFSYVEVMQDCIVFNLEINRKDEIMYKVKDNKDPEKALRMIREWDYNSKKGKIALGVLYKANAPTEEDKWPQLRDLMKRNVSWQHKGHGKEETK